MGAGSFRHIAAIPILNAGANRLDSLEFACGYSLTVGRPAAVEELVLGLSAHHDMTPSERFHVDTAKGWLWATSAEPPQEFEQTRNVVAIVGELSNWLWTALWCIDLAGCGENDYWRAGSHSALAGVYTFSRNFHLLGPIRKPYLFSPPSSVLQSAAWSRERLEVADNLLEALRTYSGPYIPRLGLANNLRLAASSTNPVEFCVRFQLVITALETFFIAPTEHMYVWSDDVKARIRYVCAGMPGLDDAFFEQVRERRNDAVHRAGLNRLTGGRNPYSATELRVEEILRCALAWGILHQQQIGDAFDNDRWPNA